MTQHESELTRLGFQSHLWHSDVLGNVKVFQKERFSLKWAATKLVTFIYVIEQAPEDRDAIEGHFAELYAFAKKHKKSWLPRGFQLGYALLPIYKGQGFSESLIKSIQTENHKRWSMFYLPSLYDTQSCKLITREGKMVWGGIYSKNIMQNTQAAIKDMPVI